jgi:hypothetical protein
MENADETDDFDPEVYRARTAEYTAYLHEQRLLGRDLPELTRYFSWAGLFHDHSLMSVQQSGDGSRVTLEIYGCHVFDEAGNESRVGWSLTFRCHFDGVVWFKARQETRFESSVAVHRPEGARDVLYCEIDTLRERIQEAEGRCIVIGDDQDTGLQFHSVLLRHSSPEGMLGLVFTDFSVEVSEPVAWELIQGHPGYRVPFGEVDGAA